MRFNVAHGGPAMIPMDVKGDSQSGEIHMSTSELEASVERFNLALGSLKNSAEKVKATKPLSEQERSVAVARIDQAIGALRRVLGEDGSHAAGQR